MSEALKKAQAAAQSIRAPSPYERFWANSSNPLHNFWINMRYNPTGKRDDFLNSVGLLSSMFGVPNPTLAESVSGAAAGLTKLPWLQRGLRASSTAFATKSTAQAAGTASVNPTPGNVASVLSSVPVPGVSAAQRALTVGAAAAGMGKAGRWIKPASMIKRVPLEVVPGTGESVKAQLEAEVADTPSTRRKGLAGRTALSEKQGMFFDTPGPFWMRGCHIPLDLLFLTKSGTILEHVTMPVPGEGPLPTFSTEKTGAVCALEVPAGWCDRHGVKPGDRIRIGGAK